MAPEEWQPTPAAVSDNLRGVMSMMSKFSGSQWLRQKSEESGRAYAWRERVAFHGEDLGFLDGTRRETIFVQPEDLPLEKRRHGLKEKI
jgi:hypothetical protein